MKKCVKCGYELEDFAVFCSECGESQQVNNNEIEQPQPEELNNELLDDQNAQEEKINQQIVESVETDNNEAGLPGVDTNEANTDKSETVEQNYETTFEQAENTIDEQITDDSSKKVKVKKSFNKFHIAALAIIVLLVATSVFMSIMYFSEKSQFADYKNDTEKKISDDKNKYDDLKLEYTYLENRFDNLYSMNNTYKKVYDEFYLFYEDGMTFDDILDLKLTYDFLLAKIGFVVPDDGYTMYHAYDCSIYQKSDSYYAFNIETCKAKGYIECPLCH